MSRPKGHELALAENHDLFVERLVATDDVVDELFEKNVLYENTLQRVQLVEMGDREKNQIIFDQLMAATRSDALKTFCSVVKKRSGQVYLVAQLETSMANISEPLAIAKPLVSPSLIDYRGKLKDRYLQFQSPRHHVIQYVRLALILEKEDATLGDECLNKITKLTLQSEVDVIRKKKVALNGLKEIFHYQNQICPRLILIMGGPGIGKTTLINEICLKWARDNFLAQDFDAVILIQLRSVQNKSLKEAMMECIGKEGYTQVMDSAGLRCLIILEGLDELAAERRQTDQFLSSLLKQRPLLKEATIIVTSRPHACEKLTVSRKIEVVGFGMEEIKEYVDRSLSGDPQSVKIFMQHLEEYPHLLSICYVPMNLAMIVEIFASSCQKSLPLTLTELYQQFIVMSLQREFSKGTGNHDQQISSFNEYEESLSRLFEGIPKE